MTECSKNLKETGFDMLSNQPGSAVAAFSRNMQLAPAVYEPRP